MAYRIFDITTFSPDEYPSYYFDANVWIAALNFYSAGTNNSHEIPYQKFFDAIVCLNETNETDGIQKIKHKPKIVVTSLVLSEIINAYMRRVAMRTFFGGGNEYKNYDFKKDYRDNPKSDYNKQLSNLCSDLKALSNYTILMSDSFDSLEPFTLIQELPFSKQDFNDLYYRELLKKHNIPYVTNDRDCKFEGILTITSNEKLLRLSPSYNRR